jgi:hypothetical protein
MIDGGETMPVASVPNSVPDPETPPPMVPELLVAAGPVVPGSGGGGVAVVVPIVLEPTVPLVPEP